MPFHAQLGSRVRTSEAVDVASSLFFEGIELFGSGQLDEALLRFQQAVVDPSSTVLQVTGNNPEAWWWRYVPTNDGPAVDPTGEQMGGYFSRVLDWYKGGFTDEFGVYHHSGHNVSFGYLEVLNEVDWNRHIYHSHDTGSVGPPPQPGSTCAPNVSAAACAEGLIANVRRYIELFDGIVRVVHRNHPDVSAATPLASSFGTLRSS